MKRGTQPDAEASVILRKERCYIIVRDKLLLVELCEYSFSKSFLDSFEVYRLEPCEDAILPVSVGEESMKVGMIG